MSKIKLICFITLFFLNLSSCGFASSENDADTGRTKEEPSSTLQAKVSQEGIKWHTYEEGMALGKNEKKKVFLSFYADWCRYCKVMDSKTFKDDSIVSYLNENFIAIKVNSDMERKLAASYRVTGLPSTCFIAETGENIGSQPGYIPPETMLPLLKYINTDSYKKMDWQKFMESM
jgi:thioredoxin-related protein